MIYEKKTMIHLRLSERMNHDLNILNKQLGMTKSDIMRIAIFNFIKENIEKP